jgi:hypothetical protein
MCIVRCAWVPTATSHLDMRLRPTLPEAQSGQCLSAYGKPPGTFDQEPRSLPQVDGRGGKGRQVVKSCSPVLNCRVEN